MAPVDAHCSEKAVGQHLPVWARSSAIPALDGGGIENCERNDARPGARVGAARRRDGAVVQQKIMVFGEGGGGDRGGGSQIGLRRGGRGEWSLKLGELSILMFHELYKDSSSSLVNGLCLMYHV